MEAIHYDAKSLHLAKAEAYRALSVCYYEPEEAFLEEDLFGQLEEALSALGSKHAPDARAMGTFFGKTPREDLRVDYTRLFLGPFTTLARPYGSVYLDGSDVVMGDSTMAVQALYHEGGFCVADAFTEMPDHVAVEMEFLYLLNARLGKGLVEPGRHQQHAKLERRLLNEHLGRWIRPFTEAIESCASTDFYRTLATLTQCFILDDLRESALASHP